MNKYEKRFLAIIGLIAVACGLIYHFHSYNNSLSHHLGVLHDYKLDEKGQLEYIVIDTGLPEKRELINIIVDENTSIHTSGDYTVEDFMNMKYGVDSVALGYYPRDRVSLENGEKAYPAYYISMQNLLVKDVKYLADGTPLTVSESTHSYIYQLPDGTELLEYSQLTGLDEFHFVTNGNISDRASQKIMEYIENIPLEFSLDDMLEFAYSEYKKPEEFQPKIAIRRINSAMENDKIICFTLSTNLSLEGQYATQINKGYVFRKENGEFIPTEKLFTCSVEEAVDTIITISQLEDDRLAQQMKKAIKPEYINFDYDAVEIWFADGSLPGHETIFIISADYTDKLLQNILQPWALPDIAE